MAYQCPFCPGGRGLYPFCPKCKRVAGKKDKRDKPPTQVRDNRTHEQRYLDERKIEIESVRRRTNDAAIAIRNKAIRRSEPTEVGETDWLGLEHSEPEKLRLDLHKPTVSVAKATETVDVYIDSSYKGEHIQSLEEPQNFKTVAQAKQYLESFAQQLTTDWSIMGRVKLKLSNRVIFTYSYDKINGFQIEPA